MSSFGRAQRVSREGGDEEWTFEAADARVAEALVSLQKRGLGGFVSLERLEDGRVRALRASGGATIEHAGAMAWREAVALIETFARAMAEHERRAGRSAADVPLGPWDFVIAPVPHLRDDALVAEMVDAEISRKSPPARHAPPEQVEGAPWDDGARRYVLGLVAYRLIAGAHPFAGEGLRRDLDERATRGVPPFADEIAAALKPGVQSLVLRMLAPRAPDRPRSATEIARECSALLAETSPGRRKSTRAIPAPRALAPRLARVAPQNPFRRRAIAAGIVVAGVAVAALGALARPSEADARHERVAPVALRGTRAEDCAGCHPREVSEWKRSVMAHASKSPLFGALESAVEEQVDRSSRCPLGAGVLRASGPDACFDDRSGLRVTGSGGEGWCINCHAPGENLKKSAPAWSALGSSVSREPLRDVLAPASLEGISCAVCHQTIGPVGPHRSGAYEGNAGWTSFVTGEEFLSRPEDRSGTFGVSNSGYLLDPRAFRDARDAGAVVHGDPSTTTRAYLRSSEFCGACHDVRLFGTDVLGATERGEHFKRLRNAYSEWRAWADGERSAGREPATCQGCHMSQYPGVCESAPGSKGDADCPPGTRFSSRPAVVDPKSVSHYFTSVEVPLTPGYPDSFATDATLDAFGVPIGERQRRDMMLRHVFSLAIENATRAGDSLRIPVRIENVGAGHRVPAGFSQEREIWLELEVRDARGALVYRVGHVDSPSEDLGDKRFLRVTTSDDVRDGLGRPLGVFGADVVDGPDVPAWSPPPSAGGTRFEGKGLVNFQNGFLRCVRCIGTIDDQGRCQPGEGQGRTRADRFADGAYDLDTGECRSNLSGTNALFETYFPVGSLDADRGVLRAPDAIIDTRSAAPGVPVEYTYLLDAAGRAGPLHVRATLHFRAFPPFLLRAFADYEARAASRGLRPSGAQVTRDMVERLEVLDLATVEADVP
ncbi:MAG TPA: hypothetical protein VGH28_14405 [Polyangiaceae bacterium]|jgi:hypothetical protein